MHRYRIVAQITLILSIFNLVLAAPIAVNWQRIHEARGNSMVIPEVGPVPLEPFPPTPQHSSDGDEMVEPEGSEAASEGSTSPKSAPASPQHSLDGSESTSSGYPTPALSEHSSESGNSWMLHRPARLTPNRPASFQGFGSAMPQIPPSQQATGLDRATAETPPDNAETRNSMSMMKKLKIGGVMAALAGTIALIAWGSSRKENKNNTRGDLN
ncbi:hypothetical protein F5888DRAFT_1636716 [Russula emetica]|nr:hypothetical protein F5888DRAFT_1636716 [Russula emetica]